MAEIPEKYIEGQWAYYNVDRNASPEALRWISALSPAVAPLLISWLEAEAACMASVSDVKRVMPEILDGINPGAGNEDTKITVTIDTSGPALAFARHIIAVLGEGSHG